MTPRSEFLSYLSLAAVCFIWGTTYLGIRVALESFAPVMLVSLRFLVSGSLMLAAAIVFRLPMPRGRELWQVLFTGVLILGIGNGTVAFAEQEIPSGLAGLIVTMSPFWLVGLESLRPGGDRLQRSSLFGMAVGFGGAVMLLGPDAARHGFSGSMVRGFLIMQLAMFCWCSGSILQRRFAFKGHPVAISALQQLAAGIVYLPGLTLSGQAHADWSPRGIGAILYLAFFGSIVGFSAYSYALTRLPVAVVSVYPYVNSVVAVSLGWVFYREPFGVREASAMAVIFTGVGLVKWAAHRQPASAPLSSRSAS